MVTINGVTYDEESLQVGRDEQCRVVIDHPRVSRIHATIERRGDAWVYIDQSTNGTFHNGERVNQVDLSGTTTLMLGGSSDGAPLAVSVDGSATLPLSPQEPLGTLSAVHKPTGKVTSIGRDAACDIVIDDLRVSRNHAQLIASTGGHDLLDLGSHNGTFVNGERISRVTLSDQDVVSIGSAIFRYTTGGLQEYQDTGQAWLESSDLVVRTPEGKTILAGVGFALEPSSLLAVVGPSGAGKSTLVNALTGFRPADEGVVVYGGRDVYDSFDDLRLRLGYVPQDDILHPQLTVQRALEYAAQLRFSPDVDASARSTRVTEVMQELGLAERATVPIERLSGGQRKRTSIGLELLTKPSLIFLDEPTSGLDPGNEAHVMELLRSLADGGRIVVVVTHSVQSLDACDRVVYLAPGGHLAFFGTPAAALEYFAQYGLDSHAEIFRALDEDRERDWAALFASHPMHERFVRQASTLSAVRRARKGEQALPPRRSQSWMSQFSVLVRRYVSVIRADRKNLILLAAQAPVFGILDAMLVPKGSMSTRFGVSASLLLWLVVIGVTWLGMGNAIREIAKESAIYRRERSVGLSISAYVASKVVVLGAITIVQALILSTIALAKQDIPPLDPVGVFPVLDLPTPAGGTVFGSMWTELMVAFVLAGLGAMAVGLLLSALMRTVERAMSILPLILIAHIVVSMPLIPQKGALAQAGYAFTSKWANDAAASTVSLNELRLPYYAAIFTGSTIVFGTQQAKDTAIKPFRPEWEHTSNAWTTDIAGVVGWFVIGVGGTYLVLRRRDRTVLGGPGATA